MPAIVKCPTCHKETPWENNPYRPFCSDRCRLIDLGRWAQEGYRIPGEEVDYGSRDKIDDEDRGD